MQLTIGNFNMSSLSNETISARLTSLQSSHQMFPLISQLKLVTQSPTIVFCKTVIGFYSKLPAEKLWKGLTSVSNAGRKKGRGKGSKRKMVKNLHFGQYVGEGEVNMVWPGLNAPIIRGKEVVQQQLLPKNEERERKMVELRDRMSVRRSRRMNPLERGWSGSKMPGRSIGPPDPVGSEKFEGFDTKVLEHKVVTRMTGKLGRVRRKSMLVVTGNKNGIIGFARGRSANNIESLSKICRNRAAKQLLYIERCDNHTVFHDFYCKYLQTRIMVYRKPEGYGLRCHRAIREICQVVGIKNLRAKVEGSTNVQRMTKAFILGLLNQRTHQELAEEKGLHVVKVREGDFPRIVASPKSRPLRTQSDIPFDEELDFKLHVMDSNVPLQLPKRDPWYVTKPFYEVHLKKTLKSRNHEKIRRQQMIDHGGLVSFLTEKYPEANYYKKVVVEED